MATTTEVTASSDALSIRERRRRLGMTRLELAVRAGCSPSYLQILEGGALPGLSRVMPRVDAALASLEHE